MARAVKSTVSTRSGAAPNLGSTLAVVFGDQLTLDSPALASLNKQHDVVLMMEVAGESGHVPSHVQRTVLFLSAMRHFAAELAAHGFRVDYVRLTAPENTHNFAGELRQAVERHRPSQVVSVRPGEWRVLGLLEDATRREGLPLTLHEDPHFICTPQQFESWARGRASLTMEYFYREQRRRTGYLITGSGRAAVPEGGTWNFDSSNRVAFPSSGPPRPVPVVPRFAPDALTRQTISDVRAALRRLPGVLGSDDDFGWPVTRAHALVALTDFIEHRLASFGPYEDAMWSTEPTVYHSVLSPALNLKLLSPRECCEAAIAAYAAGRAPLQSVEAFVRQLIGWREFIRGVYWLEGPGYAARNTLDQHGRLPEFYWTGDTDMACMRHCVSQVVHTAYAHHIQRLMVMGNFALISGVHPRAISDWYLGMFADGVDWVTLPNTLGMVMHADRRMNAPVGSTGLVGTKPYAASGKYVQRMSDYCRGCRFDPAASSGPSACPFTVFYWDFLIRGRKTFAANTRMSMMLSHVDRMTQARRVQITIDAQALRTRFGIAAGEPTPPEHTATGSQSAAHLWSEADHTR